MAFKFATVELRLASSISFPSTNFYAMPILQNSIQKVSSKQLQFFSFYLLRFDLFSKMLILKKSHRCRKKSTLENETKKGLNDS